jgi:DNA-binding NtrC family response regulator
MPRILILEDDCQYLAVLKEVIERLGHEPLACSDFDAAEALLPGLGNPGLVLSDINIRQETSFAFLEQRVLPLEHVPIVMMTADTQVIIPDRLRPPRTQLLFKPLAFAELRRILRQLISSE